jgi:hypothetical protein
MASQEDSKDQDRNFLGCARNAGSVSQLSVWFCNAWSKIFLRSLAPDDNFAQLVSSSPDRSPHSPLLLLRAPTLAISLFSSSVVFIFCSTSYTCFISVRLSATFCDSPANLLWLFCDSFMNLFFI